MRDCIAVLLHFRSAEMTLRCLTSLSDEGLTEAVVVDNSDDGGRSLAALKEAMSDQRLSVHYMEPGRNLGFAAGVNFGVSYVEVARPGHDLLLINNDATLAAGTLDRLRLAVAGEAPVVAAPMIDGPTGRVSSRTYYRHISAIITPTGPGLRGHALLGGACLMLHHAIAKNPLFDESFFFYGDDIELGFRMQRQGVALVDVPGALVVHQGSASSGNGSLFYEYNMSRAHLLLVSRLGYRSLARVYLLASRVLFLALRATVRTVRYRSFRAWHGLFMAAVDVCRGCHRRIDPPRSGKAHVRSDQ